MELEDFKSFIRTIPTIKDDVLNGRYTWQQLYEIYSLYGEDDKFWLPYKKKASVDVTALLDVIKNVDLDALSKSFEGLQKILDLVGDFVVKDQRQNHTTWYDD